MDRKNTTVIICCAGMGTRLGIGTTKALTDICGTPLILYQLKLLDEFDDIRIVVGFQAERLIQCVNEYRKDIMYAFNYQFESTGPAASMRKALIGVREYVIIMDGDVLVDPQEFQSFLDSTEECMVYSKLHSDEPIPATIIDGKVCELLGKSTLYEWPGIVRIRGDRLSRESHSNYIYEMISPLLPLKGLLINTRGIDTPDDYDRAIYWVKNDYSEEKQ